MDLINFMKDHIDAEFLRKTAFLELATQPAIASSNQQ